MATGDGAGGTEYGVFRNDWVVECVEMRVAAVAVALGRAGSDSQPTTNANCPFRVRPVVRGAITRV